MIHTANDAARFCHDLNACCEAPEKGHQKWVGQQGLKTNQGPEVQLTMMQHSLRKECSAILCESVQGEFDMILSLPIQVCIRLLIKHKIHSQNRR